MISSVVIAPLCILYYNHVFDINPQLLSIVVRIVLALIFIVPSGLLAWSIYRLFSILTGTKDARITFSPHKLSFAEVLLAMFMMITKPLYSRFIGSNNKTGTDQSGVLTLSSPFCITYPDDVVKWDHALGNACSITETPMLPLFLAAVTEPAMLLLLMHPRCPINALGAVNVRNRFSVLRPDLCQIKYLTGRHCASIVAKFPNEPRPVKRGIKYDLEVSIMMPDMAATESATVAVKGPVTVFRQVFTILEFRRSNVARTRTETETETESKKDHIHPRPSTTQPLRISILGDDPKKWATLCRDYNFIHFSGLASKAFGLPGRLAHGNHVVAKAMMYRLLSEKYIPRVEQDPTYMDVRFKRPVVIPDELEVEAQRSSKRPNGFTISSHGRTCVVVEYGTLEQLLLAGEVEE
jgi:acyl dehydratase